MNRDWLLTALLLFLPALVMSDGKDAKPTIAVLGTGDMGDSFGPRLTALGYPIIYGSRTPQSERVTALVKQTGGGASADTNRNAAHAADIILRAVAEQTA